MNRLASVRAWVVRYPVLSFYLLTFGFEFGIFGAMVALGARLSPRVIFVATQLALFSPTYVAILLTANERGWAGVRALLRKFAAWRVGIPWYLVALFGAAAVGLIARGLYDVAGVDVPPMQWFTWNTLFWNAVQGPLAEEAGWRGYVLPRLQARMSALSASLIIGVLWGAVWHLPLFLSGQYTMSPVLYVTLVVAWAIQFTWVYNHTHGSLLIAWLLHFTINLGAGVLGWAEGDLFLVYIALSWVVTLAIVAVYGPLRLARGAGEAEWAEVITKVQPVRD